MKIRVKYQAFFGYTPDNIESVATLQLHDEMNICRAYMAQAEKKGRKEEYKILQAKYKLMYQENARRNRNLKGKSYR
jgi:hypothetical protein